MHAVIKYSKENIIKKISLWVLIAFVTFNILIFAQVAIKQAFGKPNVPAKLCLSGATTINVIYIFPLSRVFGVNNIVALPFYIVRDVFYKMGINAIPEDDGEIYMWWYMVKYKEYEELIMPLIGKFYQYDDRSHDPSIFIQWTDETFRNLEGLSKNPIKDKFLKSMRFNIFVTVARDYIQGRTRIISRLNGTTKLFPYINNNAEIKRVEDILAWFFYLNDYASKNEPEGLNHFYTRTSNFFGDNLLVYNASFMILSNKIKYNKLLCNDKLIMALINSKKYLMENTMKDPRMSEIYKQKLTNEINSGLDRALLLEIEKLCPQT